MGPKHRRNRGSAKAKNPESQPQRKNSRKESSQNQSQDQPSTSDQAQRPVHVTAADVVEAAPVAVPVAGGEDQPTAAREVQDVVEAAPVAASVAGGEDQPTAAREVQDAEAAPVAVPVAGRKDQPTAAKEVQDVAEAAPGAESVAGCEDQPAAAKEIQDVVGAAQDVVGAAQDVVEAVPVAASVAGGEDQPTAAKEVQDVEAAPVAASVAGREDKPAAAKKIKDVVIAAIDVVEAAIDAVETGQDDVNTVQDAVKTIRDAAKAVQDIVEASVAASVAGREDQPTAAKEVRDVSSSTEQETLVSHHPTELPGPGKNIAIQIQEEFDSGSSCEQGTKDASQQESKDCSDFPRGADSSDKPDAVDLAPSNVAAPERRAEISSETTVKSQTAESGSEEIQSESESVVTAGSIAEVCEDHSLESIKQSTTAMEDCLLQEILESLEVPDMVTMDGSCEEDLQVVDESVPESIALKDYARPSEDGKVNVQDLMSSAPAGENVGVRGVGVADNEVVEKPEMSLNESSATIDQRACSSTDQATKVISTPDVSHCQDSRNSQQLDLSAINSTPSAKNESLQFSLPSTGHANSESHLWKYRDWALRRDASVAEVMKARKAVSTPRTDLSLSVASRLDSSEMCDDAMSPIIMSSFESKQVQEVLEETHITKKGGNPNESLSASLCEKMGSLDLGESLCRPDQEAADNKSEEAIPADKDSSVEHRGFNSKSDIQNQGFIGSDNSGNDSTDFAVHIAEADLMKLSLVLRQMTDAGGSPLDPVTSKVESCGESELKAPSSACTVPSSDASRVQVNVQEITDSISPASNDSPQASSSPPCPAIADDNLTESRTSLDDGDEDVPVVVSAPRSPPSKDESLKTSSSPSSSASMEDSVPRNPSPGISTTEDDSMKSPEATAGFPKTSPISSSANTDDLTAMEPSGPLKVLKVSLTKSAAVEEYNKKPAPASPPKRDVPAPTPERPSPAEEDVPEEILPSSPKDDVAKEPSAPSSPCEVDQQEGNSPKPGLSQDDFSSKYSAPPSPASIDDITEGVPAAAGSSMMDETLPIEHPLSDAIATLKDRSGEKAPNETEPQPESLAESDLTSESSAACEVSSTSSQTMTDECKSQQTMSDLSGSGHPASPRPAAISGSPTEEASASPVMKTDSPKKSSEPSSPATKTESIEPAPVASIEDLNASPALSSPPPLQDCSGQDAPNSPPKSPETPCDSPAKSSVALESVGIGEVSTVSLDPAVNGDSLTRTSAPSTPVAMQDDGSTRSSPPSMPGTKNASLEHTTPSPPPLRNRSGVEAPNSPPEKAKPQSESPVKSLALESSDEVSTSSLAPAVNGDGPVKSSEPLSPSMKDDGPKRNSAPSSPALRDDIPEKSSPPSSPALREDGPKQSSLPSSPATKNASPELSTFTPIEEYNRDPSTPSPPPLRNRTGMEASNSPPEKAKPQSESPVKSLAQESAIEESTSTQAPTVNGDGLAKISDPPSPSKDGPKKSSAPSSPVLKDAIPEKSLSSPALKDDGPKQSSSPSSPASKNESSEHTTFTPIEEYNRDPATPSPPPLRSGSGKEAPNSPPEEKTRPRCESPVKSSLILESAIEESTSSQAPTVNGDDPKKSSSPSSPTTKNEASLAPFTSIEDYNRSPATPSPPPLRNGSGKEAPNSPPEDDGPKKSPLPSSPATKNESSEPTPFTSIEEYNRDPATPSPPPLRSRSGREAPISPPQKDESPSESPAKSSLASETAVASGVLPSSQAPAMKGDSPTSSSETPSSSMKDDIPKKSSLSTSPAMKAGSPKRSPPSSPAMKLSSPKSSPPSSSASKNESPREITPSGPALGDDGPNGSSPPSSQAMQVDSSESSSPSSPVLMDDSPKKSTPPSSQTAKHDSLKESSTPSSPAMDVDSPKKITSPPSLASKLDSPKKVSPRPSPAVKDDSPKISPQSSPAVKDDDPKKSCSPSSPAMREKESKESSPPPSPALRDDGLKESSPPPSSAVMGDSPKKSSPQSSPAMKDGSVQNSSPPSSPALKHDDPKIFSPSSPAPRENESKESSPPPSPALRDGGLKESSSPPSSAVMDDSPKKSPLQSSPAMKDDSVQNSSPPSSPALKHDDPKRSFSPSSPALRENESKQSSPQPSPALRDDGPKKSSPHSSPAEMDDSLKKSPPQSSPAMKDDSIPKVSPPFEPLASDLKDGMVTEEVVVETAKGDQSIRIIEPENGDQSVMIIEPGNGEHDCSDDAGSESSQSIGSSPELSYSDAEDFQEEPDRAQSAEPPTQYSYLESVKRTLSRLSSSFENLLGRRSPQIPAVDDPVNTKPVADDGKESSDGSPNSTFFSPVAEKAKGESAQDVLCSEKHEEALSEGQIDHRASGSPSFSPREDPKSRAVAESPSISGPCQIRVTNFGAVSTPLKVDECPTTEPAGRQTDLDMDPKALAKRMEAMFGRMRRMEQQLQEFSASPIVPKKSGNLPETITLDSDEDIIPETPGARTISMLGRRSWMNSQPVEDDSPGQPDGPVPRSVSFSEKVVHLDDDVTEACLQESAPSKPKYAPTPFKPSPVQDASKVDLPAEEPVLPNKNLSSVRSRPPTPSPKKGYLGMRTKFSRETPFLGRSLNVDEDPSDDLASGKISRSLSIVDDLD